MRRWEVIALNGNSELTMRYFRHRNAQVYCDEMNKWKDEFSTSFEVRRRKRGEK